jgi:hypothetical protein
MLRQLTSIMIVFLAAIAANAQDTLTIRQIQEVPHGGDISPYNGQNVVTGGTVTVESGVFHVGSGVIIYLEDTDGGIFSGIRVYCPDAGGFPSLSIGDSVICQGTIIDNGMTQIEVTPGFINFRSSMGENDPLIIAANQIDPFSGGDSLAERYESVFARLTNLYLDSVQDFVNIDYWYCHDRTGHCILKLESNLIPDSFIPPPGTIFAFIQGVIDQISDHYLLKPRFLRDIRFWANDCIWNVHITPPQPMPLDTITVSADVDNIIDEVTLFFAVDGQWNNIPMIYFSGYEYRATIGPYEAGSEIDYYICVTDNQGTTCYSPYEAPFSFYTFMVVSQSPCPYLPGDVNNNGRVNGMDVVYLVNYIKGGPSPLRICDNGGGPFFVSADINGDCMVNGADIIFFVHYLKGGAPIIHCSSYPPGP